MTEASPSFLMYFRPGDGSRMIARCQFGVHLTGRCGATLTYPIPGQPWRRNPSRSYEFGIETDLISQLFLEVSTMPSSFPLHCLSDDKLWSDHSEKANAITRDTQTDTPCITIGLYDEHGRHSTYFSMLESSEVLSASLIQRTVLRLVSPYEHLPSVQFRQPTTRSLP
jgi:hypothetical protein